MFRSFYIIYSFIFFKFIFVINGQNETEKLKYEDKVGVNDIASSIVTLLGADKENTRLKELKQKLYKIDRYVIDKHKYTEFLLNETMKTDLNETNFFNALNESDHFRFLMESEPKNLYLKLKEKMNRDDVMRILSERGKNSRLSRSARKMMKSMSDDQDIDDNLVDNVVDKMIAQVPKDEHKFNFKKEDNKYWDPQGELEDLKDFHRHDGRRIFKGERTTIRYYPFMVSVHVMGRFWCGGVIYWHDLILTSAACLQLMHNNRFFRENPSVLRVRVGSNHSRIGGDMIEALEFPLKTVAAFRPLPSFRSTWKSGPDKYVRVDRMTIYDYGTIDTIMMMEVGAQYGNSFMVYVRTVYFHPSYNPRTLRHNIAVVRLRRHLYFNYHRIPKIIDISHNSYGLAPTSEVLVLGWGVTKMSQKLPYEPVFLNRKFLPVYPNVFCKEVYGDKFISSTMFCAGTFTTGEGACDHDAGGPAVLAGKLVGIISFGPAVCGYPNAPTVFTLVGAYADWIEMINETMPSYYRGKKRTTTENPFQYFTELKIKKKRSTTHIPLDNILDEITTTVATTTEAPTEPTTATTNLPLLRQKKRLKMADDSDMDGFSIDLK